MVVIPGIRIKENIQQVTKQHVKLQMPFVHEFTFNDVLN